jgi:HPt (histidine-containing phosphotransfer) domain-containing protein
MDIQMPGLDGIETTRRLKRDARLADMPVVALTAHAMASDRERFLQAGLDDYLAKPIDEAELLRVLARWLPLEPGAPPAPAPDPMRDVDPKPVLPPGLAGLRGIDLDVALDRVNGKADLLQRLIEQLHARHGDCAARIRNLAAQGAWSEATDLAHTLKGASATLAADRVARAAAAIETLLREHELDPAGLDELDAALTEIAPTPAKSVPTPVATGRSPGAAAIALLLQLEMELRENRLAARDTLASLRTACDAQAEDAALSRLVAQVDRLDYAEALATLEALAARLRRSSGADT